MKRIFYKIYWIFAKWFQPKYSVLFYEDLPERISLRKIYLIGEKHSPWQAVLVCPCGCNNLIQLSLLKESRPAWRVHIDKKNNISLYPSIHRITGCQSHFYLKRGKIEWVNDCGL